MDPGGDGLTISNFSATNILRASYDITHGDGILVPGASLATGNVLTDDGTGYLDLGPLKLGSTLTVEGRFKTSATNAAIISNRSIGSAVLSISTANWPYGTTVSQARGRSKLHPHITTTNGTPLPGPTAAQRTRSMWMAPCKRPPRAAGRHQPAMDGLPSMVRAPGGRSGGSTVSFQRSESGMLSAQPPKFRSSRIPDSPAMSQVCCKTGGSTTEAARSPAITCSPHRCRADSWGIGGSTKEFPQPRAIPLAMRTQVQSITPAQHHGWRATSVPR